jgi:aryl-alcohol dehydrogenase-like predicted oxidoreductase
LPANPPPGSYARFNTVRVQRAAARYAEIAVDAGLTPAQLAYAWAASRPYVGSTIVGATGCEQLASNLAFTSVALGEDVLAAIEAVHLQRRNPSLVD